MLRSSARRAPERSGRGWAAIAAANLYVLTRVVAALVQNTAAGEDDGSLLSVKLRRLSDRDRALVERLVDGMLEYEDR